jgi:deoxycytidylate deaminase
MAIPLKTNAIVSASPSMQAREEIDTRLSQELVIAMVGPLSSGVSTTSRILRDRLTERFGYDAPAIIKVSGLIDEDAHRVDRQPSTRKPVHERIVHLQETGNLLRKKYGTDYLAKRAVEVINRSRTSGPDQGFEKVAEGSPRRPINLRRVSVIDSLKNEAELALLRSVYKDVLVVFGVFAPDHVRTRRLKEAGVSDADVGAILDRDQGEVVPHGQQTRSIFSDADFFIRNDGDNETGLRRATERFLDVLFDVGVHTPTRAEGAMHEAASVANRSACMSRQVGAAIVDTHGDLVSVGWNDVPKHGGGLYVEDDQWSSDSTGRAADRDQRCFRFGQRICHNDHEKDLIRADLLASLKTAGVLRSDVAEADVAKAIRGTRLDAVIEFSRAIHAEMEAILAVARDSRHSLVGATLYSTTYPCHNCARHIVAAGIKELVYIQPYRKSLALKLHHDAVSEDSRTLDRTAFSQYEGVAPKHFDRLFRARAERKTAGAVRHDDPKSALPAFRQPLDSFISYELRVAAELGSMTNAGPEVAA